MKPLTFDNAATRQEFIEKLQSVANALRKARRLTMYSQHWEFWETALALEAGEAIIREQIDSISELALRHGAGGAPTCVCPCPEAGRGLIL